MKQATYSEINSTIEHFIRNTETVPKCLLIYPEDKTFFYQSMIDCIGIKSDLFDFVGLQNILQFKHVLIIGTEDVAKGEWLLV